MTPYYVRQYNNVWHTYISMSIIHKSRIQEWIAKFFVKKSTMCANLILILQT